MIHLFQTGFPITSGLTFYIHSIVVDNMYICIYASQADDGESWEREKKRNPPQLNRPVNGRREPIIISFSRFKMSSFDLMLVHADCYIYNRVLTCKDTLRISLMVRNLHGDSVGDTFSCFIASE